MTDKKSENCDKMVRYKLVNLRIKECRVIIELFSWPSLYNKLLFKPPVLKRTEGRKNRQLPSVWRIYARNVPTVSVSDSAIGKKKFFFSIIRYFVILSGYPWNQVIACILISFFFCLVHGLAIIGFSHSLYGIIMYSNLSINFRKQMN